MIFVIVFIFKSAILLAMGYKDAFVQFEDVSPSHTVFQATGLPTDEKGNLLERYMASIGNGHVATNVFTDSVYMNGVFNGLRGESHRARIPSRNNIRIMPSTGNKRHDRYSLDVRREQFLAGDFEVSHVLFVHRYYHAVIVNQIHIKATSADPEPVQLDIRSIPGLPSDDFVFDEETKYESEYDATLACGKTLAVESTRFQPHPTRVCVLSSAVPSTVTARGNTTTVTLFTAYARTLQHATADYDAVAEMVADGNHEGVLRAHVEQWEALWNDGRIEVEGSKDLAKLINACQYYIMSSLPSLRSTHSPNDMFFGLSPGGLSYGDKLMDYQGHVFWDAEIWIAPPVLHFFPQIAQEILNFRLLALPAAKEHARVKGDKGARFPWESGCTGVEVTPDCCPETQDYQIHVAGDIAFAVRQYISLTRDIDWLAKIQPGLPSHGLGLLRDIAEFWISRSSFDPAAGQYDIKHVMPPDEDHYDKDNSVYTNVIAAYAIFFAKYAACLVNSSHIPDNKDFSDFVPDEWVRIAQSLKLLHDPILNFHPEFEGYPVGELIKRADVVLLGFPLMYPMEQVVRLNDLLLYGNVTRRNGPALTWSMHAVGFLELDDLLSAEENFNRSYQPYVRQPFKIWTEAQPPTLGAINYLSAMGGFLQAVLNGYGGIRVHAERIVFMKPRLLPHTTRLYFVGLKYLENTLDITISDRNITIVLTQAAAKYPLSVQFPNKSIVYFPASRELTLELYPALEYFEIKPPPTKCPLPIDKIDGSYNSRSGEKQVNFFAWFMLCTLLALLK